MPCAIPKPPPPVVGNVTHHSIQLFWDLENKLQRKGPQEQWLRYTIEEEDHKMHTYCIIYIGYGKQHVVEGLEPRTPYRYRLKVTNPAGEYAYSPSVSVFTVVTIWLGPMSGEDLHRAVSMNDEDGLLNVLQGGHINVDTPDKLGFSALMVAAQKGYTSLMLACFCGHLDIVKFLRANGASWEARDRGGCTAMHWAVDGGHCDVIAWMINDGCKVDVKDACLGWTPLMRVSAITGNKDVASLLISAGADVNVKDKDGKTPLMNVVALLEERIKRLHRKVSLPSTARS
uniref:Fibronectin type III and ankyrin repeat domains 1 n=1 Tax=Sphenodon punctatus TaxID=8508 RepID=A0A8D0H9V3_SPHPU